MNKMRSVVSCSPVLDLSDYGIKNRCFLMTDWSFELFEGSEKREFCSKNGLPFALASRCLGQDSDHRFVKPLSEIGLFVKLDEEWFLVNKTHIVINKGQLVEGLWDKIVSYVENSEISYTVEEIRLNPLEALKEFNKFAPTGRQHCNYFPVFARGRQDICVIKRTVELGNKEGFDILFLVFKDKIGRLKHRHVVNSRRSKGSFLQLKEVLFKDDKVIVRIENNGFYNEDAWIASYIFFAKDLNLS